MISREFVGKLWGGRGGTCYTHRLFLNAFQEVIGLVGRRDGGFRVDGRFPPCSICEHSYCYK